MRFIGLDPGKTSGLVSFAVMEDEICCVEHLQLDHLGVGHYFAHAPNSWGEEDIVVAVESFTMSNGPRTQAPWSLETIGLVRYFVEREGGRLHMAFPSAHKSLIKDKVLKRAELYFPGEGHANDAARVALYIATAEYELLKWTLRNSNGSEGQAGN
jgi:hypothetical protein